MYAKSLYLIASQPRSGSLVVSLGLMSILKRKIKKVAFFRPLISKEDKADDELEFILNYFNLEQKYEEAYGFDIEEYESLLTSGKKAFIIESLIKKFKNLEKKYDFVLCLGINSTKIPYVINTNVNFAKNFGSPILNIINAKNKNHKEISEEVIIRSQNVKSQGCKHFATIINRASERLYNEFTKSNKKILDEIPVFCIPNNEELEHPTIAEVKEALNCELILGQDLRRSIKKSKLITMSMENAIKTIKDGDLIILSSDRSDALLAAFMASLSKDFQTVAGVLITERAKPDKNIINLIKSFNQSEAFPILYTNKDSYETAINVNKIKAKITLQSKRKIALALGMFDKFIDTKTIEANIQSSQVSSITPAMFEYGLFEKARSDKKTIVLPESEDERVLRACEILLRRDVVNIILLGDENEVLHKIDFLRLDLKNIKIINPLNSPLAKELTDTFYEMRKSKGLKYEAAKDALTNRTYFGTMMVYAGYADGLVSGAITTTAETIRPALQAIKTKPGISVVSSVFFMCLDRRVLVYGDCAVNQDPTAEQLAQIAISSARTAKSFGIEPKVAMLSYSTGDSGSGTEVEKVRLATKLAKEQEPSLLIEGPIQYDAAIDAKVAKTKLPNSKVAGNASVFIFPDLNTGNNTYKAVQRSSNALAIGPVLQGLKKPINDLSRGCLVEDIVNTVVITAIQAQE